MPNDVNINIVRQSEEMVARIKEHAKKLVFDNPRHTWCLDNKSVRLIESAMMIGAFIALDVEFKSEVKS
jgi:hypothetical protein